MPHWPAVPLRLIVDMGATETARLPEAQARDVLGQRIRYIGGLTDHISPAP
ncbi:MAG: hypothetical protein R3D59_17315 [Paracoccaceae bacterium]